MNRQIELVGREVTASNGNRLDRLVDGCRADGLDFDLLLGSQKGGDSASDGIGSGMAGYAQGFDKEDTSRATGWRVTSLPDVQGKAYGKKQGNETERKRKPVRNVLKVIQTWSKHGRPRQRPQTTRHDGGKMDRPDKKKL